jgi:hypothetical protein
MDGHVAPEPVKDPARFPWHGVTKMAHNYLSMDALNRAIRMREGSPPDGGNK